MIREQAVNALKGNLKAYVQTITKKSAGANMYVCPLCGSGSGTHKTGAFSIQPDGKNWKCFACNQGGDLLDLIGLKEGITDFNAKLERACEIFGIQLDKLQGASGAGAAAHQAQAQRDQSEANDRSEAASAEAPGVDYTAFYLEANKHLSETTYHRGISLETLNRFNVGYVAAWKHPKAPPAAPSSPRLIIPTSKESYLARDVRPDDQIPEREKPFMKSKVGHLHFFNIDALQTAVKPIFIVEGEFDALSIIDVGGEAIALGSVSMIRRFIDYVKEHRPAKPLILALDNDEAGEKACNAMQHSLDGLGLPFYRYNPAGNHKDANEALNADKEALRQAVEIAEIEAQREADEKADEEKDAYRKTATDFYLGNFMHGIRESANTPAIPTGFKELDEVLDGGLYEGLYIVGAISSLGKTTLVQQMADQIAKNGQDVLIFSLEMARNELIAKSISRITFQTMRAKNKKEYLAKTVRGITDGRRWKEQYTKDEAQFIVDATAEFSDYADHIYISEGMGDVGANEIRAAVARHERITCRRPVVVVDYLQLLAPENERATDKQNTDKNVMELKRISRDYKIPVIGISSFNRMSYNNAVSMEAFKESGAIEYSSDVLIGLQLKGAGTEGFNPTEAKREPVRDVELVILKNRNGQTGDTMSFKYYSRYNCFVEW